MELDRLMQPRSVAVVGASPKPGGYGHQAVANLVAAGFDGPVWPVHPTADEVLGLPAVPRLADLTASPDVVVVATPAATVVDLLGQAVAVGAGGAVVFAAGFAEVAHGRERQALLRSVALEHGLPVCGPNGNGVVNVADRAPLWGDALTLGHPGPVALVSQSGNVAVNALAARRGLRLHTVVSCGNQAVLDAADYLEHLARAEGVRSVGLYLEHEGDGRRLVAALTACAERGVGVAVLKAGRSRLGATAASAHTGAVAGDSRVLEALVTEAGGAWAHDPHELLEMAKAFGSGRRTPGRGIAVVTCSGGDAAAAADEAERLGIELPPLSSEVAAALVGRVPDTATIGNPLDYTTLIWAEVEAIADVVATVAADPGIGQVLAYYDRPDGIDATMAEAWDLTRDGIVEGARRGQAQVIVSSTLPELLPDEVAAGLCAQGIPAIAGLTTGLRVAHALLVPPPSPARLREIGRACGVPEPGPWLAEHEAKDLLRAGGVAVPAGGVAADAHEAVTLAERVGWPVAVKLSAPDLLHKSDVGALELGVDDGDGVREAVRRLRSLPGRATTPLLVEAMAAPGVELIVAARRDSVVPVLVVGLGGVWVEILEDAVVLPLPVTADRVVAALTSLRGAVLLTGARGRSPVDLDAVGRLAAAVGRLALEEDLVLLELNPVLAGPEGAAAVDAVARRAAPRPAP